MDNEPVIESAPDVDELAQECADIKARVQHLERLVDSLVDQLSARGYYTKVM